MNTGMVLNFLFIIQDPNGDVSSAPWENIWEVRVLPLVLIVRLGVSRIKRDVIHAIYAQRVNIKMKRGKLYVKYVNVVSTLI